MMTNEDVPDSRAFNADNTPESENKKGQMLVIYLPEGSVIVDRTDMDQAHAPQVIREVTPSPSPAPEPVVAAVPVQISQPNLEEIVQRAVKEALRASESPMMQPAPMRKVRNVEPYPRTSHGFSHRKRRRLNWVHGINIFLVTYVLLVSLIPAVLASAFHTAIYASKATHSEVQIMAGDLMVTKNLPASQLKVNDVFLVREGASWRLDPRLVRTTATNGSVTTITTSTVGTSTVAANYTMSSTSLVYRVTRIIPKLGYVPIALSSTLVKVLGALFLLVLNIAYHYRKRRQPRTGRAPLPV